MAKTTASSSSRPAVVLGFNRKDGNWVLIVNSGPVSRHHQLRTRSVVSRDEAIAEAKEILKRYGMKWNAKAKVTA